MTNDNIKDLGEARGQKVLADIEAGKFLALGAGYKPIEDHVDWYLANGCSHEDMLHAFAYSAAAQLFRDLPDDAEEMTVDIFICVFSDLLCYGPHRGEEAYGGRPTDDMMNKIHAKLLAALDRHRKRLARMAFVLDAREKANHDAYRPPPRIHRAATNHNLCGLW